MRNKIIALVAAVALGTAAMPTMSGSAMAFGHGVGHVAGGGHWAGGGGHWGGGGWGRGGFGRGGFGVVPGVALGLGLGGLYAYGGPYGYCDPYVYPYGSCGYY